jgi:hypothetical protein
MVPPNQSPAAHPGGSDFDGPGQMDRKNFQHRPGWPGVEGWDPGKTFFLKVFPIKSDKKDRKNLKVNNS